MSFSDGVVNGTNIYIDGVLKSTFTFHIGNQGTALGLGTGNASAPIQYFGGSMDEVRIWNVARTQTQIQNSMNCDVPQQASLAAYYRFDQGSAGGTNTGIVNAYDYSGNNNCGTLQNFALTGSTSNFITGAVGDCNTINLITPGQVTGTTAVCVNTTTTLSNSVSGGAMDE